MIITVEFSNPQKFLDHLQAGNTEAFKHAIKRHGANITIAAFGWTENVDLAIKLATTLFLRLQAEQYKNATLPLSKYLIAEVKVECERLFGYTFTDAPNSNEII